MDHDAIKARATDYIAKETDHAFRVEVLSLLQAGDWKELEDRFYRDLEFGTGGLRGVIGGGYNRMNLLVVSRATQGMADYLKKAFPGKALSACLAYDSRRCSAEFAEAAALVFAANGVKAYLFSSLRPTPELSFAIRLLGADTGVVVTASHNPPKYNGYKAYWNDGAQVIAPHDEGIIAMVGAVSEVRTMGRAEALAAGLLVMIDRQVDEAYVAMVKSKLLRPGLIKELGGKVKIVYTPLHGTGALHFERVMRELGLAVSTVPEQREPDGSFPTVSFPNPEEPAALKLAIELGVKEGADVVMATDPDADRLGIAVPDGAGGFSLVTGNQLGALHLDYLLLTMKELGRLPAKPACIKSIVTTDLQSRVAAKYGATMFECLTGFKWIAALMRRFESDGKGYTFVYGTEESYGHLVEDEVRDKDGISAAALTAEAALYWRSKGKSLLERLDELYLEHGLYEERGVSKYFEGPTGMDTMRGIMEGYRRAQPASFGGIRVARIRDVKAGAAWEPGREAAAEKVDLPPSDVLQWYLEDGTMVTVRPSGTEPKIKYYVLCRTEASGGLAEARAASAAKASAIVAEIRKAVGA
ncbi:MAG TPA: phospho-sugar mutase [Spirochaetia bacterium]|nr:phospho-sugar mutase [Spirochaetia bacterium]HRZ63557.1 phospho-sugar mutase [Spirochaetia bacterium]